MRSLSFRHAVILALGLFSAACGSGEADKRSTTLGPTSVPTTGSLSAGQSVAVPASASTPLNVRVPATSDWTLLDVSFPPRNEPLLFRTALEAKYRDGLRRTSVSTFVDQEGTVVWVQEYLRYRLNLCGHSEAVSRVMSQIDGGGIPSVCGSTSAVTFPPRNEPFDFMLQLEAKYRDGLRRTAGSSFVDVEGNIVWTQEYLRYRVSGCDHFTSQDKVFAQIDGRGVQADCKAGSTGFSGRWAGSARSTSCSADPVFASICARGLQDSLVLTLNQSGSTVTGTISLGGDAVNASGSVSGDTLSLTGSGVNSQGIRDDYDNWSTRLSGNSMTGSFRYVASLRGASIRFNMVLVGVTRTSNAVQALAAESGEQADLVIRMKELLASEP